MTTAAFIGLGVMGYPMAGHLASNGLEVRVWNRTFGKASQWAGTYTGIACDSIREAVANADIVLVCVGADKDLTEVFEGPEGILAQAPADAVLVDNTTASADMAEHL